MSVQFHSVHHFEQDIGSNRLSMMLTERAKRVSVAVVQVCCKVVLFLLDCENAVVYSHVDFECLLMPIGGRIPKQDCQ